MKTVDVYWSFRSPYSYLATPDMLSIQEEYEVSVNLRVVMPIAIRDPDILFTEAGKLRVKYIQLDWARRAEFLGLPNKWPSPDPIVQDMETLKISDEQPYIFRLSYLGVEAQRQGKGIEFAKEVASVIFSGTENWHEGDHIKDATRRAGLDLENMEEKIGSGADHAKEIEANQQSLESVGQWGVPTFVFQGEPFFGQDRADTLRWRLDNEGLKMNYIVETVLKSVEENWCDAIICTVCGGEKLKNFMYKKARENLIRNEEIKNTIENIEYFMGYRDYRFYRALQRDTKSKFIQNICEELNGIDDHFSNTAGDYYREEGYLRTIIFEVWLLSGKNNDELRNLLKNQGLANRLFVEMELHYEERLIAERKRRKEYNSPDHEGNEFDIEKWLGW